MLYRVSHPTLLQTAAHFLCLIDSAVSWTDFHALLYWVSHPTLLQTAVHINFFDSIETRKGFIYFYK
jgi:hypothetical protein